MNNKFDKQTGLEELKRSLLMMKYDSAKTLTENESKIGNVLLEQSNKSTNKSTNILTDDDMLGDTGYIRSFFQSNSDFAPSDIIGVNLANLIAGRRAGVKGCVDALDGFVNSKDLAYVLGVISSLNGKCYLDDSKSPAVLTPAINRFLELYTEDENEDLISVVQGVGTKTLPTGSEKIKKQIINKIQELKKIPCTTQQQNQQQNQRNKPLEEMFPCLKTEYIRLGTDDERGIVSNDKTIAYKHKKSGIVLYIYENGRLNYGGKMIAFTCDLLNNAKPTQQSVTKSKYILPKELSGKVKQFQDWLDKNHPGWHKKYGTLKQNLQKGYGKFGPNTNKAWVLYGKDFLVGKEEPTQTTDSSVPQQAQTNQQEPASPVTPQQVTPERQNEIISNLRDRGLIGRSIYKGQLTPEELSVLTKYMNNKGYQLIKQIDKKYGEKYVFQK